MSCQVYVELLTPRLDEPQLDEALMSFARRYEAVHEQGYIVSVPDNPMGTPRFQLVEVLQELHLPVVPDRLLMHINTFHTARELEKILGSAASVGIRQLLVVSGDGGPRLPRLKPEAIGSNTATVTSVELLRYIASRHADSFTFAVAFNPYEPREHELEKLRRKVEAGARICITQPIIGDNDCATVLERFGIHIVLGAWMSKRLQLLSDCVGYEIPPDADYDPMVNLRLLHERHPRHGLYLALLNFKTQLPLLPQFLS